MNKYFALRKANRMRTKLLNEKSQEQLKEVIRYLRRVSWDFCGIELVRNDLLDISIQANAENQELFDSISDAKTFVEEVKPSLKTLGAGDYFWFVAPLYFFFGWGVEGLLLYPVIGAVSTEHSVMCSNYAVDGDEITLLRRLLTEIYPNTSFSAVLDSYDYWNIIDNVLPQLKKEILEHNGCMFMRGDSGDCVEVVTKTAFKLWDIFGGTINSKGYKVLDPHVKAIYGDSITVQRCEEIYKILIENGFACSNVSLGVGSFSMQCIEEDGILKPFTRDTFSSCIKATYCEVDGKPIPIFKNPKEGGFKRSQKGLCFVYRDENGNLTFKDGYTSQDIPKENNLLETVFKDGKIVREQSLADIRKLMYGDKF